MRWKYVMIGIRHEERLWGAGEFYFLIWLLDTLGVHFVKIHPTYS